MKHINENELDDTCHDMTYKELWNKLHTSANEHCTLLTPDSKNLVNLDKMVFNTEAHPLLKTSTVTAEP